MMKMKMMTKITEDADDDVDDANNDDDDDDAYVLVLRSRDPAAQ